MTASWEERALEARETEEQLRIHSLKLSALPKNGSFIIYDHNDSVTFPREVDERPDIQTLYAAQQSLKQRD